MDQMKPTGGREPAIMQEISRLNKRAAALQESIAALRTRLLPILSTALLAGGPETKDTAASPPGPKLQEDLRGIAHALLSVQDDIDDILKRLEI